LRIYYDFVIKELLKKAKKPPLVKFTKEVLGEKIATTEKKEVFLKAVTDRVKDSSIEVSKYAECFGWDLHDISSDLDDKDMSFAISMLAKKIHQLYYEKSVAKTSEEKRKIQSHMGKLFGMRNDAFVKLVNLGRCSVVGIVNITSECKRSVPACVDTVTGEVLDVKKYMLFPNMKYCEIPTKGKSLDLNNIKFLGEYRAEESNTITNKHYSITFNGGEYMLSYSYKDRLTVKVDEDALPIIPYEPKSKTPQTDKKLKASDFAVDDVEYRKAVYILHGFLKDEMQEAKKRKLQKEIDRKNYEKQEEEFKRLKAERKAQYEAKVRAEEMRRANEQAKRRRAEERKNDPNYIPPKPKPKQKPRPKPKPKSNTKSNTDYKPKRKAQPKPKPQDGDKPTTPKGSAQDKDKA
jgi:hypothetical protein